MLLRVNDANEAINKQHSYMASAWKLEITLNDARKFHSHIEAACSQLLDAARHENIIVKGHRFERHNDGKWKQVSAELNSVPVDYLRNKIAFAPYRNAIERDNSVNIDDVARLQKLPCYRDISIWHEDLERCWPAISIITLIPEVATETGFIAWAKAEKEKHGRWPPTDTDKIGRQGWRQWASTNGGDREIVGAWVKSHGFNNPKGAPKTGK